MNSLSPVLLAVAFAAPSLAQTIRFANFRLTGLNGPYDAGIYQWSPDPEARIGAGPGFTAGLFLPENPAPIATATFRDTGATELFATSIDVFVPRRGLYESTVLIVRAWSTAAGTFEVARDNLGYQWGEQAFTSRPLGGWDPETSQPVWPSPDMGPGFTGFQMQPGIPEPSSVAMCSLGAAALAWQRRRSTR